MTSILPPVEGHKGPAFEKPRPTYESTSAVHAAAKKINSSKLRERLWEIFKKDLENSCRPPGEASRRFAEVFKTIGSTESIERLLLVKLETGFAPNLELLEEWTKKARDGRGYEFIEDFFGDVGEDMRLLNPDAFDQVQLQVVLGLLTGGYRVVKGVLLAIPDMANFIATVCKDPEAANKLKYLSRELIIWSLKAQFGTFEMRKEAAKQLAAVLDSVWTIVSTCFTEQWEKARDEGREVEFVTAWILQMGIEIPSLVLGAKNLPKVVEAGAGIALKAAKSAPKKITQTVIRAASKTQLVANETTTKIKNVVARVRASKTKYMPKYASHAEIFKIIGSKGEELIRAANPKVRRKIMRSFSEFLLSTSKRGPLSVEGREIFINPAGKEKTIKKMIETLTLIENDKPVPVFMIIRLGTENDPEKYFREAMAMGFKGPMHTEYQKAFGANMRLGPARYVTVGEFHTSRFEVFPNDGLIPEGYAILTANFKPKKGLNHNFEIFPSVRQPGGGVNIADKDFSDLNVFQNRNYLWKVLKPE